MSVECIEKKEDEADGNHAAQDDGVFPLLHVDPLHQAVNHWEPICRSFKDNTPPHNTEMTRRRRGEEKGERRKVRRQLLFVGCLTSQQNAHGS